MTKMTAADLTDRPVIVRFKPIRVGGSIDRGAVTWVGLTRQQTPAERVVEAARIAVAVWRNPEGTAHGDYGAMQGICLAIDELDGAQNG